MYWPQIYETLQQFKRDIQLEKLRWVSVLESSITKNFPTMVNLNGWGFND